VSHDIRNIEALDQITSTRRAALAVERQTIKD
jgi:hypothetical protein